MATESGQPGTTVAEAKLTQGSQDGQKTRDAFLSVRRMLEEEPFRVQFFQAVRMIHRMERDRQPVGHFITPQSEAIRFCSLPSLSFPASELYSLDRMENGQLRMTVQFMGLCAAISVMPATYTELLLARMREKDPAMGEFFDIFNHRLISFFYRGWEKYRFFIGYEGANEDRLSPRLLDLLGLGTIGLRGRAGISDEACLHYAGLLGRHVRTANSLQQVLEDYFGVRVAIEQFAGTWRRLERKDQTSFTGTHCAGERLGVGVVAGDEVWDHHGRIRAVLGPLRLEQYLTFLPGQDGHRELAAWLRFYSNGAYETEVQLVLERAEAPKCELGRQGRDGPQLGFVSWLKTSPLQRDPADATYLVQ